MSLLDAAFFTAINDAVYVPVVQGGDSNIVIPAKEHSKKLYEILIQVLPDQVYANSTKEKRVYPDCVYKIGGSSVIENLSIATGGETFFLVFLHAENHLSATTKFDQIDELINETEGVQIIDLASDYNEVTGKHEIAFEVVINTPLAFDDNGSVIAIEGACRSAANEYDNCLNQERTCQYHFILQTKDKATQKQAKAQLQSFLLGSTEGSLFTPMEHSQGQSVVSSGGLLSWVETYQNTEIITANF